MNQVVVGAHVKCYINGNFFAEVTGFSYNETNQKIQRRGIDKATPFEISPGIQAIQGQLSMVRVRDGGLEGNGIKPIYANVPKANYFTMTLLDRVTNTVIFEAYGCQINKQQWQVGVGSRMLGSASFVAFDYNNEVRPL